MPHSHSFISSHSLSRRANQIEQIDDRSPRIIYSGTWRKIGDPPEFRGGSQATWNNDARATFKFTGTGIKVFGTVRKTDPASGVVSSSYSLDGAEPLIYHAPTNPTTQALYFQEFFSTLSLPNQEHTLTIAFIQGSAYYLDYFEVHTDTTLRTPTLMSSRTEVLPTSNTASQSSVSPQPEANSTPTTTDFSVSSFSTNKLPVASLQTDSGLSDAQTDSRTHIENIDIVGTSSTSSAAAGPTTSTSSPSSTTALSAIKSGTIAGVVCGAFLLLGLVALFLIRRQRQKRAQKTSALRRMQPVNFVSAPWHAGLGTSGATRKLERPRFPSSSEVDGSLRGSADGRGSVTDQAPPAYSQ